MTNKTDYRQPEMSTYDGHKQWNCRWPGCEFDTFDEAAWREHIDSRTGAHRDPLSPIPGVNEPGRVLPSEREELEELRAEVEELRRFKEKADAAKEADSAQAGKTKGD